MSDAASYTPTPLLDEPDEPPTLTMAPGAASPASAAQTAADAFGASAAMQGGYFDPSPNQEDLAAAGAPLASAAEKLAAVYSAAKLSQEYDGNLSSQHAARQDAIDANNKEVQTQTGVQLQNPLTGGYSAEAAQQFKDAHGVDPPPGDPDANAEMIGYRMDAYNAARDQVRQTNPDAPALAGDGAQLGMQLANKSDSDLSSAMSAANPGGGFLGDVLPYAASFAGSFRGMMRDPMSVLGLAASGGETVAGSVLGRLAESGIRQALVNAGMQLVSEPALQKWRAQRGVESGALPALHDVGMAALFGAIPGVGVEAAKLGLHGLPAAEAPAFAQNAVKAASGDPQAAAQVAGALPKTLAPELHEAVASDAADRLTAPPAMPGVSSADNAQGFREAIRHAEDPDASPPPDPVSPVIPASAIERHAIANNPDLFTRVGSVEGDIAQARQALADIQAPGGSDGPSGALGARMSDLQQQLAEFTGKRRSSPAAQALSSQIDNLQAQSASLEAGASAQDADRAGVLRQRLVELQNGRALMGPDVFAARKASAEALAQEAAKDPAPSEAGAAAASAPDALSAARTMRAHPELWDEPLPLSGSKLRQAQGLARLSDPAWGMVERGQVPAEYASAVGRMVEDPTRHASILEDLARFKPENLQDARMMIGDALASDNAGETQARMFGMSEAPPDLPSREPLDPARQVAQLEEAHAKPEPEDDIEDPAKAENEVDAERQAPPKVPETPAEPARSRSFADTIPLADRADGADMVARRRDDVIEATPREGLLSRLVKDCVT